MMSLELEQGFVQYHPVTGEASKGDFIPAYLPLMHLASDPCDNIRREDFRATRKNSWQCCPTGREQTRKERKKLEK
jgi:hypothetical protein